MLGVPALHQKNWRVFAVELYYSSYTQRRYKFWFRSKCPRLYNELEDERLY